VSVDLLRDSYYALKRQAAPGVDGVTWQEYETGWEGRLADLHNRVHRGAYRAQPSRRVYIPKADGRQRPLGIAALEDKIVQQAVVTILNQIYEVDFQGFSYGFRPGRGPHQALDALTVGIQRKRVKWVLDADIRGFYDHMSHEWTMKFVEHRVADRRILRLIQKWLKAGVSEDGQWLESKVGTPQGAVVSPLLANRRASILSLLLPSFMELFFRGSHTTIFVTRGLSRSYNQAAEVPSSKVTCTSPRSPSTNCKIMLAFVSITHSITIFPTEFITATEILSL
jgi:group II intron reverse transcriptase/maturase